jgi:ligand-binding SRPBCC domain-containing protein
MPYRLERIQHFPRPIDEVFRFFATPENLQIITPGFVHFRFVTPSPIPMHAGAIIEFRLRLCGIPIRWKTRIIAFDPGRSFIDELIRGPYQRWHHTHEFHADASGTTMVDRIEYALPFGTLGKLAHAWFVRRALQKIFDYRAEQAALHWPAVPALAGGACGSNCGGG